MGKRVKDYVVEGNQKQLEKSLNKIIKKTRYINRWIENNHERTNQRLVFSNLLASTADYLEVMRDSLNSHISVLALSTRNIYEINVRVRSIIEVDGELENWLSETITDNVQALEGILLLREPDENLDAKNVIDREINRLKNMLELHQLPEVKRPVSTGELAKKLGLEIEHKSLFKLFSKLVHPSSYLINGYEKANSIENQKTLQIQAQLYSQDTINRVCKSLDIPLDISRPYGETDDE